MCTCFPSNTCLSDGRSVSVTTDVNAHGDMIIRIIFIRIHHKIFAYRLLGLTLLCFFLVLFGVVIVDKAGKFNRFFVQSIRCYLIHARLY